MLNMLIERYNDPFHVWCSCMAWSSCAYDGCHFQVYYFYIFLFNYSTFKWKYAFHIIFLHAIITFYDNKCCSNIVLKKLQTPAIVIMTFLTNITMKSKAMNSYWWNYFIACVNDQKFKVLKTMLVEFHAGEVSMGTLYNKYQKIGYWKISIYCIWIYDSFKLFSWWAICDRQSSWKYVFLVNWKFTANF